MMQSPLRDSRSGMFDELIEKHLFLLVVGLSRNIPQPDPTAIPHIMNPRGPEITNKVLLAAQSKAVSTINSPKSVVVHGPFGSGKTWTNSFANWSRNYSLASRNLLHDTVLVVNATVSLINQGSDVRLVSDITLASPPIPTPTICKTLLLSGKSMGPGSQPKKRRPLQGNSQNTKGSLEHIEGSKNPRVNGISICDIVIYYLVWNARQSNRQGSTQSRKDEGNEMMIDESNMVASFIPSTIFYLYPAIKKLVALGIRANSRRLAPVLNLKFRYCIMSALAQVQSWSSWMNRRGAF
jgi:hypothetical protein